MTFNAGAVVATLTLNDSQFTRTLSGANAALNAASREMNARFGAIRNSINTTANGMLAFGAAAAVGVGALAKLAMSAEQTQIAFTQMLHSADAAKAFIQDLRTFAETTPFEFTQLRDAARQMLAFGFQAQAIIPILKDVGDAVSALGGDPEKMDHVLHAIEVMQTKGRVQAREMLELTKAGIPAWRYLAEAMGTSTAAVINMSEKGLLPAQASLEALRAGMHKDFGGMMAAQMQTAAGALVNLKDQAIKVATEFGTAMLPTIKALIGDAKALTGWLDRLTDAQKAAVGQGILWAAGIGLVGGSLLKAGLGVTALLVNLKALKSVSDATAESNAREAASHLLAARAAAQRTAVNLARIQSSTTATKADIQLAQISHDVATKELASAHAVEQASSSRMAAFYKESVAARLDTEARLAQVQAERVAAAAEGELTTSQMKRFTAREAAAQRALKGAQEEERLAQRGMAAVENATAVEAQARYTATIAVVEKRQAELADAEAALQNAQANDKASKKTLERAAANVNSARTSLEKAQAEEADAAATLQVANATEKAQWTFLGLTPATWGVVAAIAAAWGAWKLYSYWANQDVRATQEQADAHAAQARIIKASIDSDHAKAESIKRLIGEYQTLTGRKKRSAEEDVHLANVIAQLNPLLRTHHDIMQNTQGVWKVNIDGALKYADALNKDTLALRHWNFENANTQLFNDKTAMTALMKTGASWLNGPASNLGHRAANLVRDYLFNSDAGKVFKKGLSGSELAWMVQPGNENLDFWGYYSALSPENQRALIELLKGAVVNVSPIGNERVSTAEISQIAAAAAKYQVDAEALQNAQAALSGYDTTSPKPSLTATVPSGTSAPATAAAKLTIAQSLQARLAAITQEAAAAKELGQAYDVAAKQAEAYRAALNQYLTPDEQGAVLPVTDARVQAVIHSLQTLQTALDAAAHQAKLDEIGQALADGLKAVDAAETTLGQTTDTQRQRTELLKTALLGYLPLLGAQSDQVKQLNSEYHRQLETLGQMETRLQANAAAGQALADAQALLADQSENNADSFGKMYVRLADSLAALRALKEPTAAEIQRLQELQAAATATHTAWMTVAGRDMSAEEEQRYADDFRRRLDATGQFQQDLLDAEDAWQQRMQQGQAQLFNEAERYRAQMAQTLAELQTQLTEAEQRNLEAALGALPAELLAPILQTQRAQLVDHLEDIRAKLGLAQAAAGNMPTTSAPTFEPAHVAASSESYTPRATPDIELGPTGASADAETTSLQIALKTAEGQLDALDRRIADLQKKSAAPPDIWTEFRDKLSGVLWDATRDKGAIRKYFQEATQIASKALLLNWWEHLTKPDANGNSPLDGWMRRAGIADKNGKIFGMFSAKGVGDGILPLIGSEQAITSGDGGYLGGAVAGMNAAQSLAAMGVTFAGGPIGMAIGALAGALLSHSQARKHAEERAQRIRDEQLAELRKMNNVLVATQDIFRSMNLNLLPGRETFGTGLEKSYAVISARGG